MPKERYPKDIIKVIKVIADNGSFQHRQKNHNVVSWSRGQESFKISFGITPSCPRSYMNFISTMRKCVNDNDLKNDKAFKKCEYLRQDLMKKKR